MAVGPEMFREDAKRTMNLIVSQMQSENMAPDDAQVLDTSAYVNVCRRSIRLHTSENMAPDDAQVLDTLTYADVCFVLSRGCSARIGRRTRAMLR